MAGGRVGMTQALLQVNATHDGCKGTHSMHIYVSCIIDTQTVAFKLEITVLMNDHTVILPYRSVRNSLSRENC